MSFNGTPTSGVNNVSYMGIQERNPRETYTFERNPTVNDFKAYKVGDRWINKLANTAFILVSKANGAGLWVPLSGGGPGLQSLTGNDAIPVLPIAGNINLIGTAAINFTTGGPGLMNAAVLTDGTTIQIIANQLTANTSGILSSLQISPDVGANISPVASILSVPGIGGNQTLNGGAGILQINNRRWLSSFVVDPSAVAGSDAEYTTVQAAINAAFAAGGGVVFIRPGTYTEGLTLRAGVDLFGASVDGRLQSGLSQVDIIGNHTFTGVGTTDLSIMTNINFQSFVGDVFTLIQPNGGSILVIAMQDCGLEATSDPTSRCVVFSGIVGGSAQFTTDNCQLSCTSHLFENVGVVDVSINLSLGTAFSLNGNAFELSAGSGSISGTNTSVNASNFIMRFGTPSGSATFIHSQISCTNECFFYTVPSLGVLLAHSSVGSSAASGNFIDGAGGSLNFVDIGLTGTATGIGAIIAQTKLNWQPYAESAAASLGSIRGTSSFDSAQFTVTDGFVQASFSGIFPWVEQNASVTVPANQGNFSVAVITLTLPAAPVMGDTCKFKVVTNDTLTIAGQVGDVLQFGNQGGSSFTNTSSGDAVELTFYNAGLWLVNSSIGNWTVNP